MLMIVHKLTPWKDFWRAGSSSVSAQLVNTQAIKRIDPLTGGSKITFLDGSTLKVSQLNRRLSSASMKFGGERRS